jgi:hypothetical protein
MDKLTRCLRLRGEYAKNARLRQPEAGRKSSRVTLAFDREGQGLKGIGAKSPNGQRRALTLRLTNECSRRSPKLP